MPKNLNRQSECFVSNPRIFKGEAIEVLLGKKIWINEAILSFKNLRYYKALMYTPITVRDSGVYQSRVFLCGGGEVSGLKDFILP
jgi:hypothetical protein